MLEKCCPDICFTTSTRFGNTKISQYFPKGWFLCSFQKAPPRVKSPPLPAPSSPAPSSPSLQLRSKIDWHFWHVPWIDFFSCLFVHPASSSQQPADEFEDFFSDYNLADSTIQSLKQQGVTLDNMVSLSKQDLTDFGIPAEEVNELHRWGKWNWNRLV